jgi:hypothetical protein
VLVAVVVLVVLLVAADRLAVFVADRAVASKIQTSQKLESRPSVKIEGFPFLTQVISNNYQAVRLKAHNVTVGDSDRRVAIRDLVARLTGIKANRDFSQATAKTVNGTATVSYAELSRVVGVPLHFDGTNASGVGRLATTKAVSALGLSVSGSVSAQVNVIGGDSLQFSSVQVKFADTGISLPQTVTDQFTSVFHDQLSLKGLPFGLAIERIVITASGVSVVAEASDVALR